MFLFLIFKDLRARKTKVVMIKNTSQCNRTHQFVFAVEEEGCNCFVKQRKLLVFLVEMGKCQSRLCCMAGNSENTSPKTARSEKSANAKRNSRSPNSERILAYVCKDDLNHPAYAASTRVEEYTRTADKSERVDEKTRRRFLRQLYRTAWRDVYQRIMKAREVALARGENGVNQGASTSTANPSSNVPSSDEWLVYYPCLFDSIGYSEDDTDDDEENCSQSSAARHTANSIKLKLFFRNEEPEERDRLQGFPQQKTEPIKRDFSKPR